MYPLPQLNLLVQSPTTPGQFDHLPLPELNLVIQSPTTPGQVDPLPPPSIEPSGTEPYYTRSVWHVEECRHTQVRCTLPLPQLNLVVQSPTTPGQVDPLPPPSIKPSGTEPYYTRSVWHVEECRHTQVRCTLPLPQLNLVVQSPTTPGQVDPLPPPSIKPSGTEPYCTMPVWHVEEM